MSSIPGLNLPKMNPDNLAKLYNLTLEELNESERVREAWKQYLSLPIDRWPSFKVLWDFDPKNQIYILDTPTKKNFEDEFPNGLIVGLVDLAELDSKFILQSQRSKKETWSVGFKYKVARVILHWVEGGPMTPPWIRQSGSRVMVGGGHHRIAVCRAKGEERIPILVIPSEKDALEKILKTLKWI